jgi:hypothetical protein
MANKIILKKTSTASKVPLPADLEVGEIAVNLADQKLYSKNASGTVILVGDGQGTGDVTGGLSSTDNALARYDGTTGKVIQNSTVTLDDNGNLANVNSVGFDTTPATVPAVVGTMSWDDGDGVTSTLLKGGNVTLQNGTQEYARVFNNSGVTVTKGQVVYISGAQGNRVSVKLAKADVEATSFGTIGLVAETIANGAEGFIIVSGALYKLNTTGLTAGATVYLSPTTAGAVTTTKPQAPNQLVVLGWVERVDNTVGSVYIKIDNGYELDELHDVQVTSPQSGNLLIYDASTTPTGVWKNANLTAGAGISVTNGAGSISIANTGVTSVSGTAPISSSGGATPAISISQATTSTNGYLSSTDWNTFNNKATLPSQTGNAGKVLGTDGTNTSWVEGGGGGSAFFTRYNFTATASQTTFAVGVTLNLIEVYNNGARLIPTTDYSISGTNVILASGASVGSIITVLVYTTFDVANTYTQAQTDALVANKANTNGSNATGTWGISISGNSATTTSATTLVTNASQSGLNFGGVFALTGSGATTSNSTGMRLSENYGAVWNGADGATWHHQMINGSYLCGFNANGGNFGNGNYYGTGNITAYYSDERLKTKTRCIDNALQKVLSLEGFIYIENEIAKSVGYKNNKEQVGLSAQKVQKVLPEAVSIAPFDMQGIAETGEIVSKSGKNYLTVDYSRIVPLLVEAIKELEGQIAELKAK